MAYLKKIPEMASCRGCKARYAPYGFGYPLMTSEDTIKLCRSCNTHLSLHIESGKNIRDLLMKIKEK